MNCNCKWLEGVVAVVVFVLTVWPGLLGASASMWIVAVAAVVLFLHSLGCKNCSVPMSNQAKGRRRKRR